MTAAASAASSRRSQWTYEPSPIGSAVDDDLEDAADGVAGRARLVDPGDHRRLGVGVRAAQRRGVGLVARPGRVGRIDGHAADLGRERPDLDAELAQERPGDAAGRDPRRRLARGRALEHVADVVEAVLERAGEVGMTGPDAGDRRRPLVAVLGRGAASSAASSSLERLDLHDLGSSSPSRGCGPGAGSASRACARAGRRPGSRRGPARSPGARRGRSRAGGGRGRPRGRPRSARARPARPRRSTPSVGPCDSPAVRKRKAAHRARGRSPSARAVSRPCAAPAPSPPARPPARPRPSASPPARASASFACISVERRRLAGPQRERGRALVEQHQLAVGDVSQPAAAASRRSRVRA